MKIVRKSKCWNGNRVDECLYCNCCDTNAEKRYRARISYMQEEQAKLKKWRVRMKKSPNFWKLPASVANAKINKIDNAIECYRYTIVQYGCMIRRLRNE